LDRIELRGMEFYAYHGVLPEERTIGQRFRVDVVIGTDLSRACASDRLEDTVNYSDVFAAVKEVVEGHRYRLLERLAQAVADHLLARFALQSVRVRIEKKTPPIAGNLEGVAVEIARQR
jgi:dihydroneopterin aldolase